MLIFGLISGNHGANQSHSRLGFTLVLDSETFQHLCHVVFDFTSNFRINLYFILLFFHFGVELLQYQGPKHLLDLFLRVSKADSRMQTDYTHVCLPFGKAFPH